MFGANTILTVYIAPKDRYSYENFRAWHKITKRRWREADVIGVEEVKVLENNRRLVSKYKPYKLYGWLEKKKTNKRESLYVNVIGDSYFDFFKKFFTYTLDWWGIQLEGPYKKIGTDGELSTKDKRNFISVPNTPMLDVGSSFDRNGFIERLYVHGESYEEAQSKSFNHNGSASLAGIISGLKKFYMDIEKTSESVANAKSMELAQIIHRVNAVTKQNTLEDDYNFFLNYYNKFVNTKIREMMKFEINFHFLKEAMSYNPNLAFYVLGPYNRLIRIHGVVGKRDENYLMIVRTRNKKNIDFVYSLTPDTKINIFKKGFIALKELKRHKFIINNMLLKDLSAEIEKRKYTEYMYDLILETKEDEEVIAWYDSRHNVFVSPNYSIKNNIDNLDILC